MLPKSLPSIIMVCVIIQPATLWCATTLRPGSACPVSRVSSANQRILKVEERAPDIGAVNPYRLHIERRGDLSSLDFHRMLQNNVSLVPEQARAAVSGLSGAKGPHFILSVPLNDPHIVVGLTDDVLDDGVNPDCHG